MTDTLTEPFPPSPARAPRRTAAVTLLLLLTALGIVARLVISWYSIGTNDAVTFWGFAHGVEQLGLNWMYANVPLFNHPPVIGYWAMFAWQLTNGGDLEEFTFIFKLPMIAADAVAMGLLFWIGLRRGGAVLGGLMAAGYGWSLTPILIGAYHCNTDNLLAVLCLVAAVLMDRADDRQGPAGRFGGWLYGAGGLALGAAINVKLIPVLLIAPLMLSCRGGRATVWFIAGLAVAALPFLYPLLVEPAGFYRNVIAYRSQPGEWGIVLLLGEAEREPSLNIWASPVSLLYNAIAPALIIVLIVLVSVLNRWRPRLGRGELAALCFGLFLVLTPGFGVQYLVVIVPLLFAVDPRFGMLFSTIGGVFLLLTYLAYWDGGIPMYSHFDWGLPRTAALIGLIAWVLLTQWTWRRMRLAGVQPGEGPRPGSTWTASGEAARGGA